MKKKNLRKKSVAKVITYLHAYYACESTELYDDESQEILGMGAEFAKEQIWKLTGVSDIAKIPASIKEAIKFFKSI